MNVEIGTEAAQFLFCKSLFQIFSIASLQCTAKPVVTLRTARGKIWTFYALT
jgi:hypothetical protein